METVLCEQQKMQQQLPLGNLAEQLEESLVLMPRFQQQEKTSKSPEQKKLLAARMRAYRAKYPERHKAALKRYYHTHRALFDKYRKDYGPRRRELYQLRKVELSAESSRKQKTRPYRDKANARLRRLRIESVHFSLADAFRATMNRAFRRNWIRKPARTESLLGCTIDEAKSHIEKQFVNGMSWKRRTSFVVDHIVPVVAFDLRDQEQVRWAFNWRNLQPLTPHDNAVKSDKLPSPLPSWLPAHIAERIIARQPKYPAVQPS